MEVEIDQIYIVNESFKELGASLYKNQTFKVTGGVDNNIHVTMIVTDVDACPPEAMNFVQWSLTSEIITEYCELIVLDIEPKKEVKIPVKRYTKEEFKLLLKNII